MANQKRIIVGISGASGAAIGVNLLKAIRSLDNVESHLIVSASGMLTATQELGIKRSELEALADIVHTCAISARRWPAAPS